jgi:hypothetical protein
MEASKLFREFAISAYREAGQIASYCAAGGGNPWERRENRGLPQVESGCREGRIYIFFN